MSKKLYIFIPLILVCLVITTTGIYFYLKRQNQLAQRHHLVCEVLKPGMSTEEVETGLDQIGSYTISKGDWGNGSIVLGIHFTNPKIDDQYSTFGLAFIDYKYFRAYVEHGSDNPEIICDFYKLVESAAETPNPPP
jgi:hypothetical protein